jgi:hypothetical protein
LWRKADGVFRGDRYSGASGTWKVSHLHELRDEVESLAERGGFFPPLCRIPFTGPDLGRNSILGGGLRPPEDSCHFRLFPVIAHQI